MSTIYVKKQLNVLNTLEKANKCNEKRKSKIKMFLNNIRKLFSR